MVSYYEPNFIEKFLTLLDFLVLKSTNLNKPLTLDTWNETVTYLKTM